MTKTESETAMKTQKFSTPLTLQLPAILFTILAACNASAATRYVWQNSPSPAPPYTNWATAAHVIQEAVDAAAPGDQVLVTNGVYATGGRAVVGTMTNRVAIDRAISVESVNGPQATTIQGRQVPGAPYGDGAIRCVYLMTGASLSGFSLTNGATRGGYDPTYRETSGGGVWCESTNAIISNCILSSNSAANFGGGAYRGTLSNCTISGNSAYSEGGGAYSNVLNNCTLTGNWAGTGGGASESALNNCTLTANGSSAFTIGGGAFRSTLNNCTLARNSANQGGGAYDCVLNNCTITGNGVRWYGGGTYGGTLNNCTITGNSASDSGGGTSSGTLNNCILYFNTTPLGETYNHAGGTLNYCCTTPLPLSGTGNFSADPQLASATYLSANSPCRGAGSATYVGGTDIDGEVWANPPSVGCDEFHTGALTGPLSVEIVAAYTNVATGFPVGLSAWIEGRTSASVWEFGDGLSATNQPYTSHAWAAPGDYAVVLRAYNQSNPGGISATGIVHVTQPVHYVAADGTNPVAPFTSWATAARTIQEAVDAATLPGALVLVTNGVYATSGRAVSGTMTNRVAVIQPLNVRSVNGPLFTVIQGRQVPGTTNGDGAVRCVYLTSGASLSGFTLTNGATRSTGDYFSEQNGGGVWCASATTVVTNCVVAGNSAACYGGGAYQGTLNNSVLLENSVRNEGGGAAFCTLNNCMIASNSAFGAFGNGGGASGCALNNCTINSNSARSGGGVYAGNLTNCTLTGNLAEDGGGTFASRLNYCVLISNLASNFGGGAHSSTLRNCTLNGNSVSNNSGGGAYESALTNCVLTGNSAYYYGGGVACSTLNNCTLVGNSAKYGGGTVFGTLTKCVLTGNSAESGGAALSATLINCTLVGNSASTLGGGATWSELNNCVVYFNNAPSGPNYHLDQTDGGILNYACTTPAPTNGVGNITSPPSFVDTNGWSNLRLQSNSPCVNAGNNAYTTNSTDLDGRPRIVGGTVDIGAYEFQGPGMSEFIGWLQQHGLPTDGSGDFADADSDGHNAWQEWKAWTVPTNALSVLKLLTPQPATNGMLLRWQSASGQNYFLERATQAGGWFSLLQSNIVGQAGITSFTETNTAGLGISIYRVGVLP